MLLRCDEVPSTGRLLPPELFTTRPVPEHLSRKNDHNEMWIRSTCVWESNTFLTFEMLGASLSGANGFDQDNNNDDDQYNSFRRVVILRVGTHGVFSA